MKPRKEDQLKDKEKKIVEILKKAIIEKYNTRLDEELQLYLDELHHSNPDIKKILKEDNIINLPVYKNNEYERKIEELNADKVVDKDKIFFKKKEKTVKIKRKRYKRSTLARTMRLFIFMISITSIVVSFFIILSGFSAYLNDEFFLETDFIEKTFAIYHIVYGASISLSLMFLINNVINERPFVLKFICLILVLLMLLNINPISRVITYLINGYSIVTIALYNSIENSNKRILFIQKAFQCCGVYRMEDWEKDYPLGNLPASCCSHIEEEPCFGSSPTLHKKSCRLVSTAYIEKNLTFILCLHIILFMSILGATFVFSIKMNKVRQKFKYKADSTSSSSSTESF